MCALLAVAPAYADDPRKLAESGWTAYQRHDLEKAEKLTRQAIAAATDPAVKAAALYNLGRVLEDRKDKAGATAAYKQSLELRHNATVREQLRTLDAAAADAADVIRPTAMDGPFPSFAEWCKKQNATCHAGSSKRPRTPLKLPATIRALDMWDLDDGMALVVVVDGSWYVQALHPWDASEHCSITESSFDGAIVHGRALEVAYTFHSNCDRREAEWKSQERAMVVVGIGPSNKPSATPDIIVAMTETTNDKTSLDWLRTPTWNKDGSLDIALARARGDSQSVSPGDDNEDVKGHHALAFP